MTVSGHDNSNNERFISRSLFMKCTTLGLPDKYNMSNLLKLNSDRKKYAIISNKAQDTKQ